MRKSQREFVFSLICSTKNALLLLFLCWGSLVWSRYQVVDSQGGSVFILDAKKQTRSGSVGASVSPGDEVFVEVGASSTLLGPGDQYFHLGEGSHVILNPNKIVLVQGTLWIQKPTGENPTFVETASGEIEHAIGDAIITYDMSNERTQLFTISGKATLSNTIETSLREVVASGEFSFVQKDRLAGRPRRATFIGRKSFAELKQRFPRVRGVQQQRPSQRVASSRKYKKTQKRSIASLSSANSNSGSSNHQSQFILLSRKNSSKQWSGKQRKTQVRYFSLNDSLMSSKRTSGPHRNKQRNNHRNSRTIASLPSNMINTAPRKQSHKVKRVSLKTNQHQHDQPATNEADWEASAKIPQSVSAEDAEVRVPSPSSGVVRRPLEDPDAKLGKTQEASKQTGKGVAEASWQQSFKEKYQRPLESAYQADRSVNSWGEQGRSQSSRRKPTSQQYTGAMTGDEDFEKSLELHYQDQQKHPDEMQSLINELESVNVDYSSDF